MANSTVDARITMLAAIGADSIDELFEQIPADHRPKYPIALSDGIRSEAELHRHFLDIIRRNVDCQSTLSFLGAGCWQHYVPAVVDEIVGRTEFATSCWGSPSSDHGLKQAVFEFTSQLGELLEMDFVGVPTYSWGCAAGHAARMAARITGRKELVVAGAVDPERLAVLRTYCQPSDMKDHIAIRLVDCDWNSGLVDLAKLDDALTDTTAAVYFENPSFLGTTETAGAEIARRAHQHGAEVIVGVDPISLGSYAPPASYGADIAVGTMQTLGLHMNAGGSTGGFIATRDDERYVSQYPSLIFSICETSRDGEHAFALAEFEQTSYGSREAGNDWVGTAVNLWAVANATYMALLGPRGITELDELILSRSHYAAKRLVSIPGVELRLSGPFFKEFVLDFTGTGYSVEDVNEYLLARGIFGGLDLSKTHRNLGQSALYCVTEIHTQKDIDKLVTTIKEMVSGE